MAAAPTARLRARIPTFAAGAVIGIAIFKLLLHLYAARFYGYFVDELYFVACSDHLSWGYVDQPPLIAVIVKLERVVLGDSLQSIRLGGALAGAATVILGGMIARELGGRRFAQALTALAVLCAPLCLAMDHYISMNAFEPVFWMVCALLVLRFFNTDNHKLWLWFGLVAGIGLNNKYSMAFFAAGIVLGVLLAPQRRVFLRPWIWLGGLIALVLILPNLLWNIQHDFPFAELMANIRRSGRNVPLSHLQFFGTQAILMLPASLPLWLAGLWFFFASRDGRPYRVLGWMYLVVIFVMLLPNGRPVRGERWHRISSIFDALRALYTLLLSRDQNAIAGTMAPPQELELENLDRRTSCLCKRPLGDATSDVFATTPAVLISVSLGSEPNEGFCSGSVCKSGASGIVYRVRVVVA